MSRLNVVLTSDTSGSMSGHKISQSKKAQKDFINKLPKGSTIGLVSFGGEVDLTHEPTTRVPQLKRSLDETSAGGGTPLLDALRLSYDLLTEKNTKWEIKDLFKSSKSKETSPPPTGQKRAIVVSSDGKAPRGGAIRELGDQIKDEGIRIIAIAIGSSAAKGLLKDLASSDEDFHVAEFSGDLPDLYEEVAAGLIVADEG